MADLRGAIASAGYTTEALRLKLRLSAELGSRPADMQVHDRRTRDGSRLSTVIRLLALNFEVDERAVAQAFAPITPAQLSGLGLVEIGGGSVRALVRLSVHGDLLIAYDRQGEGGANLVTGINSPAVLLAQLAVRRPVRQMLDLGTGNGIQGILSSRHCERIISTDVNPRALAFADFNAALNGVTNMETRLGSLYEPVAGERFGLILSNPPYVISPASDLVYRDSGLAPGEICRALVRGAEGHLDEGGHAQALVSWPLAAGQPWDEPLRAWLPPGVDAWLIHYQTEDPLTHASNWNPPLNDAAVAERGQVLDDWLRYDEREGVGQIGFGAVFLRRRQGGGTVFVSEGRAATDGAGRQVQRVLDAIAAGPLTDQQLEDTVFKPVPEQRLEQVVSPAPDGTWTVATCTVRLSAGVGSEGTLDSALATVLTALDGRVTFDAALTTAAAQLEVDAAALRPTALNMARALYQLGFLVRAEDFPAAG
jgi:methylase of polypeptide subunit release factors